jgi:hypothetical protein
MNKKVLLALLVAFLVFWMVTDPRGLADRTGAASDAALQVLGDGATALRDFIVEL